MVDFLIDVLKCISGIVVTVAPIYILYKKEKNAKERALKKSRFLQYPLGFVV
jgi:hypothetical protein